MKSIQNLRGKIKGHENKVHYFIDSPGLLIVLLLVYAMLQNEMARENAREAEKQQEEAMKSRVRVYELLDEQKRMRVEIEELKMRLSGCLWKLSRSFARLRLKRSIADIL